MSGTFGSPWKRPWCWFFGHVPGPEHEYWTGFSEYVRIQRCRRCEAYL